MRPPFHTLTRLSVLATLLLFRPAGAALLPDDRADVFYSDYKGGGTDIKTKSVLVRKQFFEQFAVEANYLVDTISGTSVDTFNSAIIPKDDRKKKALSLDYIHDKTQYNLSYANSTQRDYNSNTTHFSLSQDMFADLTTVSLGFTDTRNRISENTLNAGIVLRGFSSSRSFSGGLSQVVTKDLIAGLRGEVVTDQGYLANPYRQIRYCADPTTTVPCPGGSTYTTPIYPNTRTSTAVEARAKYYLPYRAAVSVSYRYFTDTWGIRANTTEVGYAQPILNSWILEGRIRHYNQKHASFYSDLFPSAGYQNFEARDQNLAASTNTTVGLKATYAFLPDGWKMFKRGTVTGDVSRIRFKYKDFRDTRTYQPATFTGLAGTEPLYQFDATVYQIYVSMFF